MSDFDSTTAAPHARVLRECLASICADIRWPIGHVYLVDAATTDITPTEIWYLDDPDRYAALVTATRLTAIAKFTSINIGTGLPRRVALTRRPIWLPDVTRDPRFLRRDLVADLGIGSGFAIPIHHGAEVRYVLEFFRVEVGDAEPDLIARAERHARRLEQRLN